MARETYFRLGITVTGEKLSTIIAVLNKEGSHLSVEQLDEAPKNGGGNTGRRKTKQFRTPDGRTGLDIVREIMANSKKDVLAIHMKPVLERAGFSGNSLFGQLQVLIAGKEVQKVGRGKYRWVKK
jgi:hypothetical protein